MQIVIEALSAHTFVLSFSIHFPLVRCGYMTVFWPTICKQKRCGHWHLGPERCPPSTRATMIQQWPAGRMELQDGGHRDAEASAQGHRAREFALSENCIAHCVQPETPWLSKPDNLAWRVSKSSHFMSITWPKYTRQRYFYILRKSSEPKEVYN